MTMHTTHTRKRGARSSALANEDGMLLVITMVILLVVSTLAAANLINAFLERSLAKNQNYASIALNAADAGLQAWPWPGSTTPGMPTASPAAPRIPDRPGSRRTSTRPQRLC